MALVYSNVVSYDDFIKCFRASGLGTYFSTASLKVLYEFYNEKDEDVVFSVKSICDEWEECDINYFIEEHPESNKYFLSEKCNWEKLNEIYGIIEINNNNGRIIYNKRYCIT